MPSFPLGSFTWVPADSYNYIDIYTAQAHCATKRESPARVLESSKLLKQKKVLLDVKKSKKKKKRANHYDELCLQYQYAQQWLNKRNSQVSVRLTKSELKVSVAYSHTHTLTYIRSLSKPAHSHTLILTLLHLFTHIAITLSRVSFTMSDTIGVFIAVFTCLRARNVVYLSLHFT
jgi:exopolyphosphatase/pppGpp-phosphohydrolase